MKKILLVVTILILLTPSVSFAASKSTFLGPIVPKECTCKNQPNPDGGPPIQTAPDYGCVLQVMQNSVNFGVTVATILFTLYLVIAAFQFITRGDNSEARTKARTRLINVILGLAVLLTSWLIVDYVMKTFYDKTKFGPWNGILAGKADKSDRCIVAKGAVQIFTGTIGTTLSTTPSGGGAAPIPGVISSGQLSDADTRTAFKNAGIVIANWSATNSLANTRADTVNEVIKIKQGCNCRVQVNATTGGTHQTKSPISHENGYKVDLQLDANLDAYLKRLKYVGIRPKDGTLLYHDTCGNEYAREPSHWDITIAHGLCSL